MSKKILLLVGASGSGKSSVADYLEQHYKLKTVKSYTTRPKRSENEGGHTFITEEMFSLMTDDMVAMTEVNGYHYGATNAQVDVSDIYVIDEKGVQYFLERYKGKKDFIIMRLIIDEKTCKKRMLKRGDNLEDIEYRLKFDKKREKQFDKITKDLPKDKVIKFNIGDRPIDEVAAHIYKFIFTEKETIYAIDRNGNKAISFTKYKEV